jgi:pimeloyl-ACP methyl ester carboxylesterase
MLEYFGIAFDEVNFAAATTLMRLQRRKLLSRSCTPEDIERLSELADLKPAELFPEPDLAEITREPVKKPRTLLGIPKGYELAKLSFSSPIQTGEVCNDTAVAWYLYRPGFEKATTLVYAHGWMAYDPGLWIRLPLASAAPLGANVVMLELPFHMSRSPKGTMSGELSVTPDLASSFLSLQQAVADVRAIIGWLKAQEIEKVALMGKSLGGLVASLTLLTENRVECAVLVIPAVNAGASLWRSNYTKVVRKELLRAGIDEFRTYRAMQAVNPANYDPALPGERILVIEATADRACPPEETEKLVEKWGANVERIPLGHLSIDLTPMARNLSRQFLSRWL